MIHCSYYFCHFFFRLSQYRFFVNFVVGFLSVRLSGWLSNRRQPNKDNKEYELIDLTSDEDSEGEQGIMFIS